ncbi:SYS1 domain containing protein [Trichuris trichiura]|uniref:SYS1 domain containing protein n=1 Tax=Trichuris trichiura TaxID=36087 RepID=A0A077Z2I9_TRITR|nr:SYS1 domain containing protein [Trichuris trichiura]
MVASGSFHGVKRDAALISLQILAMQSLFYLCLATLQALADLLLGVPLSVDQVVNFQIITLRNAESLARIAVCLANAVVCAAMMRFIVGRAKQCLDFSFTVYFFHFLLCLVRGGAIPTAVSWWLMQFLCVTVTTVLAEYMCMRVELQDIPLSLAPVSEV